MENLFFLLIDKFNLDKLSICSFKYYEIGSFSEDFWGAKSCVQKEARKAAGLIRKLKVPRKNGFLFRIPSFHCCPTIIFAVFYLTPKIRPVHHLNSICNIMENWWVNVICIIWWDGQFGLVFWRNLCLADCFSVSIQSRPEIFTNFPNS